MAITSQTRRIASRAPSHSESLETRLVLSTFTVTSLSDSGPGSLRAAITSANASPGADTIVFGARGTITLASQLNITDDLTINGAATAGRGGRGGRDDGKNRDDREDRGDRESDRRRSGGGAVTVSGNNVTRVFAVTGATTDLAINDLRIINGRASAPSPTGTAYGGGIDNAGASVHIMRVTLENNQAVGPTAGGGAVANLEAAKFTADGSTFSGNSVKSDPGAIAWGGAVYNDEGAVAAISGSVFHGNSAGGGSGNGGAIGAVGGSKTTIDGSSFQANCAEGTADDGAFGGAIETQNVGFNGAGTGNTTLNISRSDFTGNEARVHDAAAGADVNGQANGGAIDIEDSAVVTIDQSRFFGNRSLGGDGGAAATGGAGGAGGASFGGAINNFSATLNLSRSVFGGNATVAGTGSSGGDGGFAIGGAVSASSLAVIPFRAPTTHIDHSTFTGNRAIGGDGGKGASGGNGGAAGRGDGGALGNLFGVMTVSDSALAFNTARGGQGGAAGSGTAAPAPVGGAGGLARGGGLTNERGGDATLTRVWLAANSAVGGRGGSGAAGGDGLGGGAFNGRAAGIDPAPDQTARLTLDTSYVLGNLALGGAGGAGATGGNGFGGGIFNGNPEPVSGTPIVHLIHTLVTFNRAIGGAAGSGTGGTAGQGIGGGLYNQPGAIATADGTTRIRGNKASTSDDDVFGTVTII